MGRAVYATEAARAAGAARAPGDGLRFDRLDALRALAIAWMVAFHFAFDLNHFGFFEPRHNFHRDPLWTVQRTFILGTFLFCAGLGQAVALHAAQSWRRFWRRWAQVAGCALLVTAGSALMFPKSFIVFGVLHGMAVMLILTRLVGLLRPSTGMLLALGALAVALPRAVVPLDLLPALDHPALQWLGLVSRKPITEDYVPVLPWWGVMLWGLAAGQWLLRQRPQVLSGPLPQLLAPAALAGRWSLTIYMVHQPVLIGGILAGRQLGWW